MATVGLSQQLFDCVLLLLQKAGALNLDVTGQLVRQGLLSRTCGTGAACGLGQGHPTHAKSRAGGTARVRGTVKWDLWGGFLPVRGERRPGRGMAAFKPDGGLISEF